MLTLNTPISHLHLARRSMLGFAALMAALFLTALGSLAYITTTENRRFIEHSVGDARKALDASQELIGRALKDYAFWNDAYLYMGGSEVDTEWAYVRDNMGTSLFRTYAIAGAFIVGSGGDTRYALINGTMSRIKLDQYVTGDLAPLFAAARRVADTDRVSHGYYAVAGQPAIVYAAVLKPTLAPPGVSDEQLSLLVYVDLIDTAHLRKWQDNYALDHLSVVLSDQPSPGHTYFISHADAGGPLQLRWKGEAPGDTLLRVALPMLCAVLLGFGLIAGYFYRSAIRSATLFDLSRLRIEHLARHDPLTGLANRVTLQQHLEALACTASGRAYVISLDLDRFKPINDAYGHAVGDLVLCEVAGRLQRLVHAPDLAARFGGDEFVLVINGGPMGIEALCDALCQTIGQPVHVDGKSLEVGVSIGVARSPTDATQPADLLRLSDIALYAAKADGRNTWKCYEPGMDRRQG